MNPNRILKKIIKYIIESSRSIIYFRNYLPIIYFDSKNFGDALNLPFLELVTKKKIVSADFSVFELLKSTFRIGSNYMVIGSVINKCKKNTVIWGAGLISDDVSQLKSPKKIHAVRGPLTRDILIRNNIDCPKVYGDPALLLPLLYNDRKAKSYKLGIIPHYVDKDNVWLEQFRESDECLIINILVGKDWKHFVDQVQSCERIISSSLHGLIIADAYKIPSLWVQFSNKIIGNGFKFRDYYLSVGKPINSPYLIQKGAELNDIIQIIQKDEIVFDYTKLIECCPMNINISFFE